MKTLIFALLIVAATALPAFAQVSKDYRLCDSSGHCADISSSGKIILA